MMYHNVPPLSITISPGDDRGYNDPVDIELLTIPEVLKLLHISRTSLYRHLAAGGLKHLKVGRRVLFEKAAVEAWLKTKRVK